MGESPRGSLHRGRILAQSTSQPSLVVVLMVPCCPAQAATITIRDRRGTCLSALRSGNTNGRRKVLLAMKRVVLLV